MKKIIIVMFSLVLTPLALAKEVVKVQTPTCSTLDKSEIDFIKDLCNQNPEYAKNSKICSIDSKKSINKQVFKDAQWETTCVNGKLRFAHINIYGNLIKIPSSIGDLINLRMLGITNSNLTSSESIPNEMGKLINLGSLDFSNTKLEVLPNSITNLGNLQFLLLWNCGLKKLPDGIGKLNRLGQIMLTGNPELKDIPDSFANLKPNLHTVTMDESQLSSMSDHAKKILKNFRIDSSEDLD